MLEVKICTCTLCYVMGGSELQSIDEHIPEELLDKIEIRGVAGFPECSNIDENGPRAPFVMVGKRLISEATIENVVEAIKEALK
ncbi:MAG: hypothetical protein RSF94_05215 [Rikenellaceae bacterium]